MPTTDQPSGTVTFLFTDIEGSTQRWEQHPAAMGAALARHDVLLRQAIMARGGHVFKTVGDAFCAAFDTAPAALSAALDALRALEAEPWGEVGPIRVRMALHSGAAELRDSDYFGPPLNRVARLLSAGHGGQVLLSLPTAELVRHALPEEADLRDLGQHRLKDLVRPEHVFQLVFPGLPAEFPTLRSLDLRPNNLPIQATPFVGREQQLAAARERLLREEVHLLTLTGPGGTGKTRFALQVAADLIDQFEDGVFFVSLAHADEPALVVSAIAEALRVQESAGRPLLDTLKEYLRDKQLLLVLDNFEQVLTAARVVAELFLACPRLKILVTSRAALRLYGEHDFLVPPLALPDHHNLPPVEQLSQYEAVRLFIERAQAVRPDFAVTNENAPAVAEICYRLDGLPLAIELAAARIRLLSPQAMINRIEHRLPLLTGGARDLPARQQTLRGAIAWGYDLLDDDEKALFRRLAVFADGCTLEAAEAVSESVDVFDGVASLVEKSLLRQDEQPDGEPRFLMLHTVREYALEELEASGEAAAVRRHHAEYYVALTEQAELKLRGPEQARWLGLLEVEYDNLREALDWFGEHGEAEAQLRLAGNLGWFWFLRNHLSEGSGWLESALALAGPSADPRARAKALLAAGALATVHGDYPTARARLEEGAAVFGQLEAREGVASCLTFLGSVAMFQGDHPAQMRLHDQAETLLRQTGDSWRLALVLFFKGNGEYARGDYAAASASNQESQAIFRALGDRWGTALPLAILGRLAWQHGDHAAARAQLEESLAIRRETGDRWGSSHLLNGLGDLARAEGDYERARLLYRESLRLFREMGGRGGMASALHNLAYVVGHQGDYAHAATHFGESLELFREFGDRRGVAECLAGLGGVAAARGRPGRAARLFGTAEALLQAVGAPMSPSNVADYERNLAAARAELDQATFEAAWAEGRTMPFEAAIELALEAPLPV